MLKVIDARGMQCPQPVIEAKHALKELSEGRLEVLVDNDIAVQNLQKLASYLSMDSASEQVAEDYYRVIFEINKTEDFDSREEGPEESGFDCMQRGCVVVLSSDRMGEGDDELGAILMKGFLYALTQLERLPETVLLYNAGARLSSEGSESVEDLKLLESQGVEVMTCGTCLNQYGLAERLAVGGITNMYTIAEKMTQASNIVRP